MYFLHLCSSPCFVDSANNILSSFSYRCRRVRYGKIFTDCCGVPLLVPEKALQRIFDASFEVYCYRMGRVAASLVRSTVCQWHRVIATSVVHFKVDHFCVSSNSGSQPLTILQLSWKMTPSDVFLQHENTDQMVILARGRWRVKFWQAPLLLYHRAGS